MASIDWARYALSATWVLVLMGGLLWWLRRRKSALFPKLDARRIQVLEICPLGLKHKMMLVQADQQMVLVSVNPQGLQTLHAWPADASAHLPSTVSQGVNHAV
jgi:flagellar biogenesis protein FliO